MGDNNLGANISLKECFGKDGFLIKEKAGSFISAVGDLLQGALDETLSSVVSYETAGDAVGFLTSKGGSLEQAFNSLGQGAVGRVFGSGGKARSREGAFKKALEVAVMSSANREGGLLSITNHRDVNGSSIPYSEEEIIDKKNELLGSQGLPIEAPTVPKRTNIPNEPTYESPKKTLNVAEYAAVNTSGFENSQGRQEGEYKKFLSQGGSDSTETDGQGIQSLGGDLGSSTETDDGLYAEVRADAASVSVVLDEKETPPRETPRPSRDPNQQTGNEYVAPTPLSSNPQGETLDYGDYAPMSTLGRRGKILPSIDSKDDQRPDDNGKFSGLRSQVRMENDYLVPGVQGNDHAPEPPPRPSREGSGLPSMTPEEVAAAEDLLGVNNVGRPPAPLPRPVPKEDNIGRSPAPLPRTGNAASVDRKTPMPAPRGPVLGAHTARVSGRHGSGVDGEKSVVGKHTASALASQGGGGVQQGQ